MKQSAKKYLTIVLSLLLVCMSVCTAAAEAVEVPEEGTVYDFAAQEGSSFTCQSVVNWFASSDEQDQLYGRFYYPENFDATKTYPTIVMAHGAGITSDIYNAYYAPAIASAGYVCFSYDVRGVSGSFGRSSYSTNNAGREPNLDTYIADANAALDFVLEHSYVDKANLYMWGQSMGAVTTQVITSQRGEQLNGTILLYGAISASNIETFQNGTEVDLLAALDNIKANFTKETILILGAEDDIFPYTVSIENAAYYSDYTFLYISGANHGFGYRADRATVIATEAVKDFLARTVSRE